LFFINACGYKNEKNTQYFCERLTLNCNKKENIVVFYTSKGILKIKLFDDSNPVTVANFISKVKSNIYVNKNFYKIINYSNNKLIQSGLNKENELGEMNIKDAEGIESIPLEIKLNNKEPIYETYIVNPLEIKNLRHKFVKGSLSMVKINKKRSSSTEFFFTSNNLPEFDGRYSIFGIVISGSEILDEIDKNDLIKKIEFH
tara:strand:- start:48 stop:650 length:603 start_codon:yes stop_codon:yes gene_type:complete